MLTAEAVTARGALSSASRARGGSPLARLFSLVTLGDYVSFYLALLNGVDPTPVQAIERFKRAASPAKRRVTPVRRLSCRDRLRRARRRRCSRMPS